jgi:hypothetical protein
VYCVRGQLREILTISIICNLCSLLCIIVVAGAITCKPNTGNNYSLYCTNILLYSDFNYLHNQAQKTTFRWQNTAK